MKRRLPIPLILLAVGTLSLVACGKSDKTPGSGPAQPELAGSMPPASPLEPALEAGADSDSAEPEASKDGLARPPWIDTHEDELLVPSFPRPQAGSVVEIPGGTLYLGSPVGDTARTQYAEVDLVPVQIQPFTIDALPYPGDPGAPFRTAVTQKEAADLCAADGKRLCTEVEWEWACKSADGRRYPSGNSYQAERYSAEQPLEPVSPNGVWAFGRLLEWTASPFGKEAEQALFATMRGYTGTLNTPPERGSRCAFRKKREPESAGPNLGFRCCGGPVNDYVVELEPSRPPFDFYSDFERARFQEIVRSIPELAAVHDAPVMFDEHDLRTVLARRRHTKEELAKQGLIFDVRPIRWIPRRGMELLVIVGTNHTHSFVAALHEVEDKTRYVNASSMILWDQPLPMVVGYQQGKREKLFWGPCFGCRDGGSVIYDEEKNEILLTHRW